MLIVRYRHFLVMTTFLFAPHIHRLAQPHRYLLVVTNGLRVVSLHIRRPIIPAPPYPCSSARGYRLFTARGILKPQLVKPASFIGLRPYRHLRLRPRQAPRRTVVLMVRPPHDYRLVRVPVQEVNNHLRPRAVSPVTKPRPRPRLRYPNPARTRLRCRVIPVPVKLHPYPAMFVAEDFSPAGPVTMALCGPSTFGLLCSRGRHVRSAGITSN